MRLNVPIILTLFRVVLIPFFILAFYLPTRHAPFITALIFLIAAVTDWFDGYLARRLKQTTRFGAFLDPVADKLMVAIALVLITEHYHAWWISIPAIIMISREILISALREWMAEIGKRKSVAVSIIGKIKTVAQMTALTWLLWRPNDFIFGAGIIALYIASALTLWSMCQYLWASHPDLLNDEAE
ncbi:CDP-diacylglycerol--glycerol-3-phosphate 3-phosphatidyltransferase [Utexia brackfieldae]|uniref:CDP-diacylglycerol--glycerol-3-phosphate 3-phosphatidyltransferase n=1 Tax=Utexia brackfieldae TaxID=3074108 RepID=UPI00370D2C2B